MITILPPCLTCPRASISLWTSLDTWGEDMIDKLLCGSAAIALLAACGGASTGGGTPSTTFSTTAPASAQAAALSTQGYAAGTAVFDPTTYSYDATAHAFTLDTSTGTSTSIESFTLANVTPSSADFTYKGNTSALTGTFPNFSGTHPSFPQGISISFITSASSSGGPKVALYSFEAGTAGGSTVPNNPGDFGVIAVGPNSDPTNVTALTGAATYDDGGAARARIIVAHNNGGVFNHGQASGEITLTADFDANTINGQIFNITDTGSDSGYEITNGATITLDSGAITGNTFNNGLTIDGSQFGLSNVATGYASGMFYGSNGSPTVGKGGTTIGGTLGGTGTSSVTGGNAVISGGFVAQ